MIKAKDIVKTYRRGSEKIAALKGVSFCVEQGEFVILFGPSGAGKTTTLNIIGGMDMPDQGSISVLNQNLSKKELIQLRRFHIGFVFSEFFLIPTLTAHENVAMPLLWSGKTDSKRALELLSLVGLKHRINHYPKELSGGEMQRVAIARALINEPEILLADEPTANLDTGTRDSVIQLFDKLNLEKNLTIVLASHDGDLTRKDYRTIVLDDGRIVEQ